MKAKVKTIDPNTLSVPALHRLLLSAIAPRPIALASTINAKGNVNLSPFSFFNVFSANPPILIFSPARKGRDNTTKHTYENVKYNHEVVVNIVNYDIVEQMSLSSTEYEEGVNEFVKSGLTETPSLMIVPPRVAESPVSFECKVQKIIELGEQGGAGNLIISKIVMVHIAEKYLDESMGLDTKKLDLVSRMGGNWYCRAVEEALFEIPKPLYSKGIGVDQLPSHVLSSTILNGNNLGRLGNLERIPSVDAIYRLKDSNEITRILEIADPQKQQKELHKCALSYIDKNELKTALTVLFCLS